MSTEILQIWVYGFYLRPVRAPKANGVCERLGGTLRRECRDLISADARLLVADRYSGSFAAGGYGVYSRMKQTWRPTLGEVDGEPSIVLLNERNGAWEIEGIIRLDIGAEGQVEHVSDYQHCPWILTSGSIVVRRSID